MDNSILNFIQNATRKGEKLLVILLDPDKTSPVEIPSIIKRIKKLEANLIFVGGSLIKNDTTENFVKTLKNYTTIPIVLFPGDYSQITNYADGILFLSLLSGRNPEYLIEQQIKAVPFLKNTSLEIIPTGYILIDGGVKTSVLKVSNTTPISQNNIELAVNTAVAGEYKGKKLIYLEAGSGAKNAVKSSLIANVKKEITVPLIVGGGIKTKQQIQTVFNSGADIVVIGNAFENNIL